MKNKSCANRKVIYLANKKPEEPTKISVTSCAIQRKFFFSSRIVCSLACRMVWSKFKDSRKKLYILKVLTRSHVTPATF